jgi:hypothetical protein
LIEDGPCLLKTVISIVTIGNKSAVPLIKKRLGDLKMLMKEVKSDITEFNMRVCELMNQLYAADQDYLELLDKLFEAYESASDQTFAAYIKEKQSRWEDNELALVPDKLMGLASGEDIMLVDLFSVNIPNYLCRISLDSASRA